MLSFILATILLLAQSDDMKAIGPKHCSVLNDLFVWHSYFLFDHTADQTRGAVPKHESEKSNLHFASRYLCRIDQMNQLIGFLLSSPNSLLLALIMFGPLVELLFDP